MKTFHCYEGNHDDFAAAETARMRILARPRTCAHCGEREARREYQDEETCKWHAACSVCDSWTKAPDVRGVLCGANERDRRLHKAQAIVVGGGARECPGEPNLLDLASE